MKKGDKIVGIILIIVVVITLGAVGIYKTAIKGSAKVAIVKSDGKVVKTIDLTKVVEPQEFTIKTKNGNYNIVSVKPNTIRVIEADCPHQEDVKQGWISEPGEMIICLPNKLVISIKGQENNEIDGASY